MCAGLLRRYAPRKDDACTNINAMQYYIHKGRALGMGAWRPDLVVQLIQYWMRRI